VYRVVDELMEYILRSSRFGLVVDVADRPGAYVRRMRFRGELKHVRA